MNKEELTDKAIAQYREMCSYDSAIKSIAGPLPPNSYRTIVETFTLQNRRDRQKATWESAITQLNKEAKQLYKEHRAELGGLYEMARDEMEAAGTPFNFGEDIAAIEESSPLNALGAKILDLEQVHIGLVDAALA